MTLRYGSRSITGKLQFGESGLASLLSQKWFLATGVIADGHWRDDALWTSTDMFNADQLWSGGVWKDGALWSGDEILTALSVSAAAAYSLRKLRATVAAIRVRRSPDNAELDIGFTATGDLDTAALLAFVGTGDGFVTTWYDQSGNGRAAIQATAAAQPRVVNAGVLNVAGGKPALWVDGVDDFLRTPVWARPDQGSVVATVKTEIVGTRMWLGSSNTARTKLGHSNTQDFYRFAGATTAPAKTYVVNQPTVRSVVSQTGSQRHFADGTELTAGSASTLSDNGSLTLGASTDGQFWVGDVSEIVIFDTAISDTNRLLLERNQGSHYGIAVS